MERHVKTQYYVVAEGVWREGDQGPECVRPATAEEIRRFRFSRLVPRPYASGERPEPVLPREQAEKLAVAMTSGDQADDATVPAGYTYLGQFVDHDLTMDRTERSLGERVTVDELLQGRSPALDLDSLYGLGPSHPDGARFFAEDGASLKMGRTSAVDDLPEFEGFDLPRRETSTSEPGTALIPDHRNDENLAVAQTHLAFIRFHNRVVRDLSTSGWSSTAVFTEARRQVTLHYQWMLRHDYLPRIVDPEIVEDVFRKGRRFFEVPGRRDRYVSGRIHPGDTPTMPVEFSVAAFRLGHSMVRGGYEWNTVFNNEEPPDPRRLGPATLALLFGFSGTSGFLGATNPLPSNWIADFRRLFDFVKDAGASAEFGVRPEQFNHAKRIDTRLVDPLKDLPLGSFGGSPSTPEIERNLAFRNLLRADMVALATGQEAAKFLRVDGNRRLTAKEILEGSGGVVLDPPGDWERFTERTPLWFYILREAEFNDGRLGPVGGRIVAEVFHRAMEGSRHSIVREPWWRPHLGPQPGKFTMPHLLLYAFENNPALLNPVG